MRVASSSGGTLRWKPPRQSIETLTPVVPRGLIGIPLVPVSVMVPHAPSSPGVRGAILREYRDSTIAAVGGRGNSASGERGGVMAARRQRISSGGPFEVKFGYSRAVRVDNYVAVAGTTAIKDGAPFAPGDAGAQTRYILEVIERALTEAGASLSDVFRYRVFLTDIADAEAVGNEMGRVFGAIRPAGTMVGNSTLVNPDLRVEIEVDAIVGSVTQNSEVAEKVDPDETES